MNQGMHLATCAYFEGEINEYRSFTEDSYVIIKKKYLKCVEAYD